jgi:hypothetical protein
MTPTSASVAPIDRCPDYDDTGAGCQLLVAHHGPHATDKTR